MTIEEALTLGAGSYVCHPAKREFSTTGTVMPPIRVTKVWVNDRQTIVLVRLASVGGDQWLDARGYELPLHGKRYDRQDHAWLTPEEFAQRKREREQRTATA